LDYELKNQALSLGIKIFFNSNKEEECDIIATGPSKVSGIVKGMSFETNHKGIHIMQLNDKTSFRGYSYIFIADGHGSMATVLLGRYGEADKEFKETKENFIKECNMKIKNSHEWAGFGSFSLNGPYTRHKKLIVGEAAGLLDYLWGFGMKYAFISGYLAAKSIIENKDYKRLVKENFSDSLKNSLVNRFIWERLGNKGYKDILEVSSVFGDPLPILNQMYNYNLSKRILYPIAYLNLRKRLKN
jgi:flavin-dependent dehydrogenase